MKSLRVWRFLLCAGWWPDAGDAIGRGRALALALGPVVVGGRTFGRWWPGYSDLYTPGLQLWLGAWWVELSFELAGDE